MTELKFDYLVAGAGAAGMAFVDTLLSESDASVLIVDDRHRPGGHWNDAYPFVRLHQPSHFYGVASTPLGSKRIDSNGSNAGFFELASGAEVQSYFERVMNERFLPSGRVRYLPMTRYIGAHEIENTLSGKRSNVTVNRRVVDSTYFQTTVPSRHERPFNVSPEASCIPPNRLPIDAPTHEHFCILGGGKTAMDVGVWLLDNGVSPERITWVCPRQSWLINRDVTQGSVEFFEQCIGGFANQMEANATATSVDDLFDRLEACGFLVRIDKTQRPEMFHFATISHGEVAQLRRITQVVQQGHVDAIGDGHVRMKDDFEFDVPADTLHIDCTASAADFVSGRKRPVFEDDLITIQALRVPNPCLSAAITAYVEARYDNDEKRNQLCQVVPLPDDQVGWMRSTLGNMVNQAIWSQEPELNAFITNCRLDGFAAVIRDADLNDPVRAQIMQKLSSNAMPAAGNLQKLLAEADAQI